MSRDDYDDRVRRENDLVLNPHEYCFIQDTNSGMVNTVVGPKKETLQNTDSPMQYDPDSRSYSKTSLSHATQKFAQAAESNYIILRNPAVDGTHPKEGISNKAVELQYGREVNIPGPVAFALWPGQEAIVREGHRLRSNQYLLVRVVNTKTARENMEAQVATDEEGKQAEIKDFKLATGALNVIKGTDVSFYIPPTGIEVVYDKDEKTFVRDALTLERLQYCILIDENGDRRYEKGPDVVFPKPTERFERSDPEPGQKNTTVHATGKGSRVFKAVELNENMGIYIKVTDTYEEDGMTYYPGDEIFITGKTQRIYYPRPEHVTIKYDGKFMHYAVAIPTGRGIYVLDKSNGDVRTVRGNSMFLPDPRSEVVVKKILKDSKVQLMYPDNSQAREYNKKLRSSQLKDGYLEEDRRRMFKGSSEVLEGDMPRGMLLLGDGERGITEDAVTNSFDDGVQRKSTYTPPRSIQLDQYTGAVVVCVWPGYCIQIVKGTGERRVVEGPASVILDYDEELEELTFSTGCPKTDYNPEKTVYLRTKNNVVSDQVTVVTKDLVEVDIILSYKVNFVNLEKAFDVGDYIKFFTDSCRSIIRNAVKKIGIQEFHASGEDIVRDLILGKKEKDVARPGRHFEENGMHIYDVDVLGMRVGDDEIDRMITESQHETVEQTLELAAKERKVQNKEQLEALTQKELKLIQETAILKDDIIMASAERLNNLEVLHLTNEKARLTDKTDIATGERAILDANRASEEKHTQAMLKLEIEAFQKKFGAIDDKLVAALQSLASSKLAESLCENLPDATGTIGLLSGQGGVNGLLQLVAGTELEDNIKSIMKKSSSKQIAQNKYGVE